MANQPSHGITKQAQVVVVMVPFPAQGHLNQLLQLSRLILSYNIPVHYVGATTHNLQARKRVSGWDPDASANIHFLDMEIPPFHCPPPNPSAKIKFPSHLQPVFNASSHLAAPVSKLLRALSCKARKVIVIHDSLMGSVIQEARLLPNVESYIFRSVSAFLVSLNAWGLEGKIAEDNEFFPRDIPSLEGCYTAEFSDFVASQFNNNQKVNSGCVYNTCKMVEGAYMDFLDRQTAKEGIKHWALGPFNPVTIPERSKTKRFCLDWLDKHARNSVIYVSFGTTTTLDDEQIKELAIGLRESKQSFVWVLRDADEGDVFNGKERRAEVLPEGYEDSVEGTGLVVRDWAPQLEILAHPATGGFMSHCGWNSCMESITMGVPIAAWPMHSDQPRNAVLITEILKIGVVVKEWALGDEIVTSKIVESAVKRLMASTEGDEMRKRAEEMGESVRGSVAEGGVSRMEMESFIAHITG
ncbi:hypothetical protein OIU78_003598 [Salix suchowensis]|nr:zeatin O-glucosyltransferase [Salix suchowensis]KAJ6363454.1 hypothetical protein OIU78_003598 [Salix suchowensis]